MENYSPLRYPGGKSTLYPIIENAIKVNQLTSCTYVEPFAGGAGLALGLIINEIVDCIIINDADRAIYSFWKSVTEHSHWFTEKIASIPITIDEWRRQKEILHNSTRYTKELGFATFFLNRTCRSGILTAGPIGGYSQEGAYKLDCRFNRESLIKKINNISKHRKNIHVYNQDISTFLKKYLPLVNGNVFVYFDPPYYDKGQRLYLNYFSNSDHERLKGEISKVGCQWIMTYDDNPKIESLYSGFEVCHFSINYSLSAKKKGGELMIFKDARSKPSIDVVSNLSHAVLFRDIV